MEIEPYLNAGGVRFGMTADDVIKTLGDPDLIDKNQEGEVILRYRDMGVVLSRDGAAEVYFVPEASVQIKGIDVFSDPDAFVALCRWDGAPKESYGFIVLLNLGITLTGFHDVDSSQLAVTAFSRGRWDEFTGEMEDFVVDA